MIENCETNTLPPLERSVVRKLSANRKTMTMWSQNMIIPWRTLIKLCVTICFFCLQSWNRTFEIALQHICSVERRQHLFWGAHWPGLSYVTALSLTTWEFFRKEKWDWFTKIDEKEFVCLFGTSFYVPTCRRRTSTYCRYNRGDTFLFTSFRCMSNQKVQ